MKMTNDTATYRAVQAVAPGRLELTTKPLREPRRAIFQRSLVCGFLARRALYTDWPSFRE